ncbi:MAG: acyltransferase [Burkholderiaceae bacterium]|nr:acyltransferase [Burkholderiaceae bacterium]
MLGTFRLFLAILVALSHADVRVWGLNPGVVAVVGFYLISGYVMTGLMQRHYVGYARIPSFYIDRVLRLYPQYLAVGLLTLAWFFSAGTFTPFLQHPPSAADLLNNLLVVPLNYFMYNGSDQFTLMPPTWSLGTEFQFYLIFPLILLWRARIVTFVLSLAIFIAAATGMINSEIFGYRLLPGILIFFLFGSALYDAHHHSPARALTVTLVAVAGGLLLAVLLAVKGHLPLPYNKETLFGLVVFVPMLYWLGKLRQHPLDNYIGDLSYGVFLNHFLIQWGVMGLPVGVPQLCGYIGLCILLSAATQYVSERPAMHLRRWLRSKSPKP